MVLSTIEKYDISNMRKLLCDFPDQVEDAVRIGREAELAFPANMRISNIVLTGLGGSAIGGDLLRSYLGGDLRVPFLVNRNYTLPEFVDDATLVIVSSYSGNTEETISAHRDAVKRKAAVLCISSNGETEKLAAKHGHPLVTIPGGYPPRAALGYSFFPTLLALRALKLIPAQDAAIKETISLLRKKAAAYSSPSKQNTALEIARQLYTKLPVIYSPGERLDVVNTRWRGQLAENAKVLAFGHVLPEMNHNELVGWKVLRRIIQDMVVICLHDRDDLDRVKLRMDITKEIVGHYAASVIDVESEGKTLLARIFSLIYLGDWVSFYLAMLNGIDPTPVKVIDYLKGELGKVK
jgi:glucose/mannose-6-phosphate isomerase